MSLHNSASQVIERCKGSTSPLAIFSAKHPHKFNVLFADNSQTQHDIKKKRGFIALVRSGDSLEDLKILLEKV